MKVRELNYNKTQSLSPIVTNLIVFCGERMAVTLVSLYVLPSAGVEAGIESIVIGYFLDHAVVT